MTTSSASVCIGISYPQARELATQIDAATPSAKLLCQAGFSYPVAIELARQAAAGTGDVAKLILSGLNPPLAAAIKAAIDVP